MARMIPSQVSEDTRSYAERDLFDVFRNGLTNDYWVYHSQSWTAQTPAQGTWEGEADFIIVHPQHGILVLEVKGGNIRYDGRTDTWWQNDHVMDKDPFLQAQKTKHYLLDLLKREPVFLTPDRRARVPIITHAVAFPDVTVDQRMLTLKAPRQIVFDRSNKLDVRSWVEAHFAYNKGEQTWATFTEPQLQVVDQLLAPQFTLRALFADNFADEERKLLELTAQQYRIVDGMAHNMRVAFAGCAGSGKTLLAVYRARRLAEQGRRVLLCCYNRKLAEHLDESIDDRPDNFDVYHFHRLAYRLARRAGISLQQAGATDEQFFDEIMPEAMADAIQLLGAEYDAIVVDEAQDFRENWWIPLQMLLHEPNNGILTVFYDDNQNIYGGVQRIRNIVPFDFVLHQNCRNTQRINAVVNQYYVGARPVEALGPPGQEVQWLTYIDGRSMLKQLRGLLHRLVNEEKVDPYDIVILTPRAIKHSTLNDNRSLGNFTLYTEDEPYIEGGIFFTTINQFKGLESQVVILVELEQGGRERDKILYIGSSRARSLLVIMSGQ